MANITVNLKVWRQAGPKEKGQFKTYTVATIDYLVDLKRYGFENAISRSDSPEIIRDYFVDYFRYLAQQNGGKITASKDGRVTTE